MSKVILVTGAAHGIGESIARRLAGAGDRVLLVDIDRRVLDVAQEIGDKARAFLVDLEDAEAIRSLFEGFAEDPGRLDGVVNNAAFQRQEAPLVEEPLAIWERVMNVCLRAPFLVMKHALPMMMAQGSGAIVNLSSIHALRAYRGSPAYDTAKAGMMGLTRQVALDYGPYGIRVNSVLPGLITERPASDAQARAYPVGRVGRPEDVARVVEFLLDDEASGFVSGAAISVDGGLGAYSPEVRPGPHGNPGRDPWSAP